MQLTLIADEGEYIRIHCEGAITQPPTTDDRDPLAHLLGPNAPGRKVLFDLEGVDWVDSGGISWLIVWHRRFQVAGGNLIFHSVRPRVTEIFRFCKLDHLFALGKDESAARALASGGKS
jgi:anti-anti-sigma factor